MVFVAAATDGIVMSSHFVMACLKIGTKGYLDILKSSLLSWIESYLQSNTGVSWWEGAIFYVGWHLNFHDNIL